jgi:hypothetical protein
MVLASPDTGPLLTPTPSSSPPKIPFRSYSAITPPRHGNPTPPPPGGRGSSRRGRGMGGQNGPQADADVLRHPRHSATALRQSADDTTTNQTTTSHRRCGRAGRESHDAMQTTTRAAPGPRPHTHAGTAPRQLTMHISTNDLHCWKPARLLQLAPSGGRPHCRPPATAPPRIAPPHQQRRTALED